MESRQALDGGYRISVRHRMEFELGKEDQIVGKVSDPIPSCLPDTNQTDPSSYNKHA
jgi:hypothetical protein